MTKVVVNFSGGKDSTVAILEVMKRYPKDQIVLCFQDTGAEYVETRGYVEQIAGMLGLELVILEPKRDWYEQIRHDKFFFTPALRKCTWRLKVDTFRSWFARNRSKWGNHIVVAYGLRAEESLSRSKLNPWRYNDTRLSTKDCAVDLWLPSFYKRADEVKEQVRAEGLPLHPCYEFSSRCNCWLCIFARYGEVRAYAEVHPELWEKACLLEDEIKCKWKEHFAISDLMKQGHLL